MEDSPALNYAPSFDSSYTEDIYQQFANFALVPTFSHFLSFFCLNFSISSAVVKMKVQTLQCLRSAPCEALILTGHLLTAARPSTLFIFDPIIDGTFLQERPAETFKAGSIPVLIGWVSSFTEFYWNNKSRNALDFWQFEYRRRHKAVWTTSSPSQ